MPLSFNPEQSLTYLGDSADLYAYVYDRETDTPVPQAEIAGVSFQIQAPDGSTATQAGEVTADGTGFTRYAATDTRGHYAVVATFQFVDGKLTSVRSDFEVIDPFNPPAPTTADVIGNLVWRKLEDCFDAEEEGPWLRDMTMNIFDKQKMPQFIDEAIFDINQQNPPTTLNADYFVHEGIASTDAPLVALGTFLAVILHLMASYTEQPNLANGQVAYEDRRDYVQRWMAIYQVEMQRYMRWLALWKRSFLGLGHSKLLISNKSGRLVQAPFRSYTSGRGYR